MDYYCIAPGLGKDGVYRALTLRELKSEWSESTVESKNILEKLVPLFLGTDHAGSVNTLCTAVNSFDFDKGLELLNRLELEISL